MREDTGDVKREPRDVRVTDFDMPFLSMVAVLTKLAIAAVPALLIVGALVVIALVVIG